MLQQPAVFVDLETTGTSLVHDRITEIAVIEIHAGHVVNEWSTLVDPECSIPEYIQSLTGISNDMVAGAPTFAAIAENLHEALSGRLFIAHNARFDYGFLRAAFERCGLAFRAPVLCTVKLSRRLFPQERRHNLDSLIQRHGLACAARHRALGDARAMLAFVEQVCHTLPPGQIEAAVTAILRRPALPPGLTESDIDNLPDTSGVYLFYDARDVLLYIGKSIHLRTRILSHFSADRRSRADARIVQQVARIEIIPTAGELGALLLEARLVKQRQPLHNRRLRRQNDLVALHWDAGTPGAVPTLIDAGGLDTATLQGVYGVFRSRRQAQNTLHELANGKALCLKRLGLEKGGGACFGHQLKKCRGVCAGLEDEIRHHLRMLEALSALRLARWPWQGVIGIHERCARSGREEIHIIDQWCYLGGVQDREGLQELLESAPQPAFDLDTYRLLLRYLQKHPRPAVVMPAAEGTVMTHCDKYGRCATEQTG